MNWKDLSYTQKGFTIGLNIGIILNIIALFAVLVCDDYYIAPCAIYSHLYFIEVLITPLIYFYIFFTAAVFTVIGIGAYGLPLASSPMYPLMTVISAIIPTFIFAGTGAFVGWIVGKIKSSKGGGGMGTAAVGRKEEEKGTVNRPPFPPPSGRLIFKKLHRPTKSECIRFRNFSLLYLCS